MKKIELGEATLFLSQEVLREHKARAKENKISLKRMLNAAMNTFFYNRIHNRLYSFFEHWQNKHPGVAILNAHGHRKKGVWYFEDDGEQKTVQSWVDSVDGKYGAIALLVCDESVLYNLPKTKKSLLFLPDGPVVYGIEHIVHGTQHHFSLIHPTYGEIDSYTVDSAIKELITTQ